MQNKVFGKDGDKSVWMRLFSSMSGSQHQNEEQQKFKKLLSANLTKELNSLFDKLYPHC